MDIKIPESEGLSVRLSKNFF